MMKGRGWVVVAKVGESIAAKRTDSCGDMEQLESMELILVSEHETKMDAVHAAKAKRDTKDGWRYAAMSRRDYVASVEPDASRAA